MANLSPSAQRCQDALNRLGFSFQVVELPQTTRSAKDAAAAIGCSVEQIVKSLVFRGAVSGKPLLVVASGSNRVDESLLAAACGEPVAKADADFVQQETGFAIGGVPPAGHIQPIATFVDQDLLQLVEIWAAAGNSNAVFKLTPQTLVGLTQGMVIAIH
jgi:prolyl-tRNA editing enzyme YbaK/EbsC (Cys-tRNA(Pro) deacylase)